MIFFPKNVGHQKNFFLPKCDNTKKNVKTQSVTKLGMLQTSKTRNVTSKTQNVAKLKSSKCDKTQNMTKLINSHCHKIQKRKL